MKKRLRKVGSEAKVLYILNLPPTSHDWCYALFKSEDVQVFPAYIEVRCQTEAQARAFADLWDSGWEPRKD